MPDYQGIGLGTKFLNEIADLYSDYDFTITTSAKNLINALNKSQYWCFKRYGRCKKGQTFKKSFVKAYRGNVKTASFLYVHKNKK